MSQAQRSTTQTAAAFPRWMASDFVGDWLPFDVPALTGLPDHLDTAGRTAVANGLATPDLCLIQGGSAEIRSVIAREIAGRSPGATLLLAPEPVALQPLCTRRCANCVGARPVKRSWLGRFLAGMFGRREKPAPCSHAPITATFDAIPEGSFERVIVLEAQRLDRATFESAAMQTRRCVFIGSLEPHSTFERVWRMTTFEPWISEQGRLVCRLRTVPRECRDKLEIETVADRPDIELRILPQPQPELAEIAFPAGMAREEAEAYVVQQLGEAPAGGTAHGRAVTLPTHRRAEDTIVAAQAVETLA